MYKCKRCKSEKYVKAGFVKTEQRYKCKKCGCQFVTTRNKGRSKEEKLMAVWIYSHGLLFRAISKLLKVSVRFVFIWIKQFAEDNYSKPIPQNESVIIELDEMWHFLHSKKDKSGFGKLTVEQQNNSLTGNVGHEILKHLQNCIED